MTWMLTATGAQIDLRLMPAADISILDIAQGLARIDRFNGACVRPYCVAEHSLLVCDILATEHHAHLAVRLAGLLHDAHAAYTGDLSSPMKALIGEAWAREEHRIAVRVQRRFGIHVDSNAWADVIKHADLTALSTERKQLMPPDPAGAQPWPVLQSHPPVNWINLHDQAKFGWADWRDAFLDRFAELRFALGNVELSRDQRRTGL
jgi:hypothetical protein